MYDSIFMVIVMKYLVVSDSHGMDYELNDLLEMYPNMDGYFHLGDSELSKQDMQGFQAVIGNNDYNYLPNMLVVAVGNKKAVLVHSHRQGPFHLVANLATLAREQEADFVFYGHTHVFADEIYDGIRVMNPGSLWRSRDNGSHSYAIFEIDEEGNTSFTRMEFE